MDPLTPLLFLFVIKAQGNAWQTMGVQEQRHSLSLSPNLELRNCVQQAVANQRVQTAAA